MKNRKIKAILFSPLIGSLAVLIFIAGYFLIDINFKRQFNGSGISMFSLSNITSPVTVDTNFADTLSFDSKWDYLWYIIVDNNGNLENTLGDSINKSDTIHIYHSANCLTNHQGEHRVRYCNAKIMNDTIQLVFMPELPAYASSLTVLICNNNFRSDFLAKYSMFRPDEKLTWTITKQQLILNNSEYKIGDIIKGYIDVGFVESSEMPGEKIVNNKYYFKGYFKTRLAENE